MPRRNSTAGGYPFDSLQVQWVQGPIAGSRARRSRLIEMLPYGSEDVRALR